MSEERKTIICIGCPRGCALDVRTDGKNELSVTGNICARGKKYAKTEIFDPRRTISTTVPVRGGEISLLPVRSAVPLPKGKISEALAEIKKIVVQAPVDMRQVILTAVAGTDIDIVACRPVAVAANKSKK